MIYKLKRWFGMIRNAALVNRENKNLKNQLTKLKWFKKDEKIKVSPSNLRIMKMLTKIKATKVRRKRIRRLFHKRIRRKLLRRLVREDLMTRSAYAKIFMANSQRKLTKEKNKEKGGLWNPLNLKLWFLEEIV